MKATVIAEDGARVTPSGVPATRARRRPWVAYPFLIGAFPIMAFYSQNVFEARPRDLALPLGLVAGMTGILWLLVRQVLRDSYRAGLVVTVAIALFCTVTHVSEAVDEGLQWLSYLWVHSYAIHVWTPIPVGLAVGLAVVLASLAATCRRDLSGLTSYLNVFALILVVLPSSSVILQRGKESNRPFTAAPRLPLAVSGGPIKPPDIYYIVLDGFARGDVQQEIFGYDLEPVLERLERRGFFVARHATANYCQTPLSLSSSLNAAYLNGLVQVDKYDTGPLGKMIGDGAVLRALRSQGYTFVSYASGFEQTEHPEADIYRSPYIYINTFHRMLLSETPLASLLPNPGERDSYTMTRDRTNYLFDTLADIAKNPAPTFTLAHVLGPHPPFVFGENGEDVSPRSVRYYLNDGDVYYRYYGDANAYIRGYRAEAVYLARRVEEAIDKLLAASPEPPVIIVQSDHGSGSRLSTGSAEETDLHERMSILNAYYLPGRTAAEAGLYDTISPVNSFRVVFNAYLGAKLPLLPDRNYYSSWSEPYNFIDVTETVQALQDRSSKNAPRDP